MADFSIADDCIAIDDRVVFVCGLPLLGPMKRRFSTLRM
jgi:hypothetical protein